MITPLRRVAELACHPTDDPEYRVRKVTMTSFAGLMTLGGVLWGTAYWLDGTVRSAFIPYTYSILVTLSLVFVAKYKHLFHAFAHFQILLSLLLPFLLQWSLGGFSGSGAAMIWSVISLMAALVVLPQWQSRVWFGAFICLMLISAVFDSKFKQLGEVSSLPSHWQHFSNLAAVCSIVFFVFEIFVARVRRHNHIMKESEVRLREELRESNAAALHAAKLASIGELAAGVGHEINNPLSIGVGNLEQLEFQMKKANLLSSEFKAIIDKQKMANTRIADIVLGLRTFARQDEAEESVFSIRAAVEQTIRLVGEIFSKEGLVLEHCLDDLTQDYFVKGNIGRLQQVFINLLNNARDATEGQTVRQIKCEIDGDSHFVELSVSDNGKGMDGEICARIFEPFFTTKERGRGTGIGLGIAAQIVQSMNGTIAVESKKGVGTRFLIRLPIASAPEVENPLIAPSFPASSTSSDEESWIPRSVLVVDDEEGVREVLILALESFGIVHIDQASSGEQALGMLDSRPYDLVFSDLQMPGLDGSSFVRAIASQFGLDRPLIVLVTGGVVTDLKSLGETSGIVDAYFYKPFERKKVGEIISSAKKTYDFHRKSLRSAS